PAGPPGLPCGIPPVRGGVWPGWAARGGGPVQSGQKGRLGNVLVRKGTNSRGDFRHIPGCTSATDVGCVIAFSTFGGPVPPDALFGPSSGALSHANAARFDVLCTNPAALGGGPAALDSIVP